MKHKISIIIPVYGVEPYIEDCLRSVMKQDYSGPLECILVDDCSPDQSIYIAKQVLKEYHGSINFRIVTHERNKGLSGARNTGIKESTGEYVYFLDSDDEITRDCISSLAEPLANKRYDMVVGEYSVQGAEDKYQHLHVSDKEIVGHEPIISSKRMSIWYPMAVNKLYNKEFMADNKLEFCEGIIHEDELFSAKLACVMESMYVKSSASTYIYKIRNGSITTTLNINKRLDSYSKILTDFRRFIDSLKHEKQTGTNDMIEILFNQACIIAYRYNSSTYYHNYVKFRGIVSKYYSNRFWHNNRLKAFIRDIHYMLPPIFGKYVYRIVCLRNAQKDR